MANQYKLIKWKTPKGSEGKLSGRGRGNGWPTAFTIYGNIIPVFEVFCDDNYVAADVRTGDHSPLTVTINDYRHGDKIVVREIKREFPTLAIAKAWCENFIENHPGFLPESSTPPKKFRRKGVKAWSNHYERSHEQSH